MRDTDIVAVDGSVIQAADHGVDRWEVRHFCGGLQRRIQVTSSSMACLDCGESVSIYDSPDLTSGTVAVMTDGELSARQEP